MDDYIINDFQRENFKNAFMMYFKELNIEVENWDSLFEEMNQENDTYALVKTSDDESIIGFIMFKQDELTNWFFKEKIGFLREVWIKEEYRNLGYGSELLMKTEGFFKEKSIHKLVLTTNTAKSFYIRNGFICDEAYHAINDDEVMIKNI